VQANYFGAISSLLYFGEVLIVQNSNWSSLRGVISPNTNFLSKFVEYFLNEQLCRLSLLRRICVYKFRFLSALLLR
jgi:hypothetical protein